MPFDSTKVRQPKITVLPPTITDNGIRLPPISPDRGGGGGGRVHIEIEIVDRRERGPSRRGGSFVFWLIVLLVIAALAHADNGAIHYDHWQDTNGWHGETRTQGTTTDWTSYGPQGQQKHCHRYYVGDQPQTTCN
jgi:hypothetical protein